MLFVAGSMLLVIGLWMIGCTIQRPGRHRAAEPGRPFRVELLTPRPGAVLERR